MTPHHLDPEGNIVLRVSPEMALMLMYLIAHTSDNFCRSLKLPSVAPSGTDELHMTYLYLGELREKGILPATHREFYDNLVDPSIWNHFRKQLPTCERCTSKAT